MHADPDKAWALLDDYWKMGFSLLHNGAKGWSKMEFSFANGPPGDTVRRYRMTGIWYYGDGDGKEQTGAALGGVAMS